jgi:pimeloyl-ACP methyl ester carboxylesterase
VRREAKPLDGQQDIKSRIKGSEVKMEKGFILASILAILLASCQAAVSPPPKITPTPFIGSARIELGDISMYFEAHGAGEALILLHGGFGSADIWANQIPVFSEYYYVIAPDSRAQGRTTDSDALISYHLMAEDMIRLMDYLGISSAYIVGWSDGGDIGIDLAIHHPERVKKLVAFGANISPDGYQDSFLNYVRNATIEDIKLMVGNKYLEMMPDSARLAIILEKIRTLYLTEPNFTLKELAAITAPTLILDGQNETVIRLDQPLKIAESIPGAQLVILPNAGHNAVTENPSAWNNAVLDFLKDK